MNEYIAFYSTQLIIGSVLGVACAVLGVFVLLQRQTLFAATISQAGILASALLAFVGPWLHETGSHIGGEHASSAGSLSWPILILSVALMAPFYYFRKRETPNLDAVLVAGIVFFSAAGQILTIAGGLRTHMLNAYFGNILTIGAGDSFYVFIILVPCAAGFIWIYRSLVSLSFDRDQARLSGISVDWINLAFFVMLSVVAAVTIRLMGSIYTLAQIVIPAVFALAWTRSIRLALLLSAAYALVATLGGFMISLVPVPIDGQEINLPTSSVIVLCLVAGCLSVVFRKR